MEWQPSGTVLSVRLHVQDRLMSAGIRVGPAGSTDTAHLLQVSGAGGATAWDLFALMVQDV